MPVDVKVQIRESNAYLSQLNADNANKARPELQKLLRAAVDLLVVDGQ